MLIRYLKTGIYFLTIHTVKDGNDSNGSYITESDRLVTYLEIKYPEKRLKLIIVSQKIVLIVLEK